MRNKLFTAFLCGFLLMGIITPILSTNDEFSSANSSPNKAFQTSSGLITWHEDCSSTIKFTEYPEWNMDWWYEDYYVTAGDMTSDGDVFSFSNIPPATSPVRWHGPIYAHNLSQPFVLGDLQNLSVHIDADNSLGSYSGIIRVYLCDGDFVPAIEVFLSDSWNSVSQGHNRAHYRYNKSSYVYHGNGAYIPWTTFNDTISVWSETNGDLYASVPGFGSSLLLPSEDVEQSREIKYVVIQASRLAGYTLMPMEIRDIYLEYDVPESSSPSSLTWHHDGSNTTAFAGVADDTWYGNPNVHVDGSINSTGGYIYADDYGTGTISYGPMMYHTFSSPFYVSDFNSIEAEIELEGFTAATYGGASVVLFDENQDPVITINVADAWGGYSGAAAWISYDFSNGTRYLTPYELSDAVSTPYNESILVVLNSTGLYASIPRIGNYSIIDYGDIEHDRIISYIAVNFRASVSGPVSETSRIHDILLEHEPSSFPLPFIWHNDCSNTTGFVRDPDWNKPGWNTWVHSDGDLTSSGDYIQFSGIPSASGWHGPVFVYDLGHTFKLSTLTNFSITLDVDNTVAAQLGRTYVTLADENGIGSVGNSVYDYLAGSSQGMYTCGYRRLNTTVTSHGAPDPTSFSSVTGKFMMWVQDGELMSEVPGYGQGSLGPLDSTEGQREIRYVVMTYGRYDSDPIMDVRIEDIYLEYTPTSYFGGSWHHDGSNMTAFDGVGDDSWLWAHSTPDLLTTLGTLNSSGQYIYSEDLGSPPVERSWFGPMWYHTLETPFQFSRFGTLDVEVEINPSGVAGATGGIFVTLHDDSGIPIIKVQVRDPFIATTEVMPTASWHFANGTPMYPGASVLISSPYHQTISIELNATGLYANLPGVGEGLITEHDNLEDRQVSYVSIMIAGSKEASSPPWPHTDIVRVHNIRMTWLSDSPVSSINHPGDLEFESGMTGNDVVWNLSTEIGAPYIIYLDVAVIDSGTYDGQPLSVNVDAYSFGIHNLTVWCDTTGGVLTDLVWVTILPSTSPTIDSPPDVEYQVGQVGSYITWNPSDLYPASYNISINGVPEVSDTWDGSSITINVDGHSAGTYEYGISVFDQAGHAMNDVVDVIVTETPLSDTLSIDSPVDIVFEYGTTGHNITWSPSSTLPSSYELYVNGVLTDSGAWDGSQIVVDLDLLTVGAYNYTLSVSNTLEDTVSDMVIVVVTGQSDDGNLTIIAIGVGSLFVIVIIVGVVCRGRGGGGPPAAPDSYDW